jgi:threonine/homoserine/homoserine lactone efflux protein
MPPDTLAALAALAVATLFTPGPNNAMLAASGATFGFRRTLPHLAGVALGFPLMLLIVGLALGNLIHTSTILREGLRWGGALLLLWIAWKIATAGGAKPADATLRPMRFHEAAAFQWINPKAWTMAVAATSGYVAPEAPVLTAGIVGVVFMTLGLLSSASWSYGGQAIGGWLTTPGRMRVFNLAMAALIAVSVAEILAG